MKLTIFGRSYIVNPNMYPIANEISKLLNHDDTHIFYIAQNRMAASDDDSLLFVNIPMHSIYPIFLHVFNETVEPYADSVLNTFPFSSVIEAAPIEYKICPKSEIEARNGNLTNRYGYCMDRSTLLICPNLNAAFEPFSTIKEASKKAERSSVRIATTKSSYKPMPKTQLPNADQMEQPHTLRNDHAKSDMKPIGSSSITAKPTQKTIITPHQVQKPVAKPAPSTANTGNIKTFCRINEESVVLILSVNKEIAVINKKTGSIVITKFEDIYKNDLLGVNNESSLIKAIGRCPMIAYDVKTINISDLRHVIRLYEKRKDDAITNQMFAMQNGCLHMTIAPAALATSGMSIKNSAIELHKKAEPEYEKIRSAIKAYNSDTYLVLSQDGAFVMIAEKTKQAKVIPIKSIYDLIPTATTLGDLLAMFPDRMIINGSSISIRSESDVVAIAQVPDRAIALCKYKTTVRDRIYAYDPVSKTIMFGNANA